MEELKFSCGTKVKYVDGIRVRRTYAGLIEGQPSDELNERCWRAFINSIENPSPCVIDPSIDTSKGYPRLPEYLCVAMLSHTSSTKDPKKDMSYGSIVWSQNANPITSGLELKEIAKNLNWADVSEDGDWW